MPIKADGGYKMQESAFQTLAENLAEIVVRFDRNMRFVFVNSVFEQITGIWRDRFFGKTNREIGMPEEVCVSWERALAKAAEKGRKIEFEFCFPARFGRQSFCGKVLPEFDGTGRLKTLMLVARNITVQIQAEACINQICFHDNVTGLYNRAYFEESTAWLDTRGSLPISFIIGDVNFLKLANDVFGHAEGDRLLNSIARILRRYCRNEDIIARWGGDEFAVILPKTDADAAEEICRRIKKAAEKIRDLRIPPSISLGVAVKQREHENIRTIIAAAEKHMYNDKLKKNRENRNIVISSLLAKLRRRKPLYDDHLERIRKICRPFACILNLGARELRDLQVIIPMHEIGKVIVPDEYIRKPGPLTREQWEIVKRCPETGFHIAKTFADTVKVSEEILSLNEHWDGSGYPRGLKGEEIPFLSRFFSIMDSYDTMTHDRPYASTLTPERALDELLAQAGKQFDPAIVRKFVEIFDNTYDPIRSTSKYRPLNLPQQFLNN